jgi:hypothetical protein
VSRQPQRVVVAIAALVLILAGAVTGWLLLRSPASPRASLLQGPIDMRTAFSPAEPQFGDPVTALVDVFVDGRTIDPTSVRLDLRVPPYVAVGHERSERTVGHVSVLRFATRIECVEIGCVPRGSIRDFAFPLLTIHYRERGVAQTAQIAWPQLHVHSRLSAALRTHPALRLTGLHSAPPSFRVSPRPAGIALLAVAALLGLAGAGLLLALAVAPLRARRRGPGPLERILLELQASGANGNTGRRRGALEQLALELATLDGALSQESRTLAWAPTEPPPDAIEELARRARELVR